MLIVQNRRARFEYHIIETFEAGMQITGSEIKSIRAGEISLEESYVRSDEGKRELFLVNAHVRQYSHSALEEYDALRPRKLLLHRREIDKLIQAISREGLTIIPLDIHLLKGRAKLQIALAKGKKIGDKRENVKEREAKRDMARAISRK